MADLSGSLSLPEMNVANRILGSGVGVRNLAFASLTGLPKP